jgi:4-amino-4-deoxychorismate lyase
VLQQALGLTMPSLVGLKSLNRLEQVLLKNEADGRGWAEALVTDVQGTVVEGVSSNCFIRLNNTWITPELRYNGVHGVMRAEILLRMQQHGIHCEQRFIDMEEISKFESLFFCNALSPMKVVTELNQQALNVQACIELFNNLQLNQIR